MTKNHKIIILFLGFVIAIGIGIAGATAIRNNQYEKAKIYNTSIQATETDRFNYAVDSRQGNVLGSGMFFAKEHMTIEDISGEYFRISKIKERYTRHTRTYECGTEESPRTCTETYYTWDYAGDEEFTTPTLTFHEREYPTNIFAISVSRRVGCDVILINCKNSYRYEDTGWWESEGDVRWYYRVTDLSFFGTILTNTKEGTLLPVNGSRIVIQNEDIPTVLKQVNDSSGATVFLVGWSLMVLIICGIVFKEIVYGPDTAL